jgi:hypothetical protein
MSATQRLWLELRTRVSLWWSIVWRGWWRVLLLAWAMLASWDTIQSQLLPTSWQDNSPRFLDAISDRPWYVWALAFLLFLLLAALEGAYREISRRDASITREPPEQYERPSITVTVINDPRCRMYLEVLNSGEYGEFQAQIEMLDGRSFVHGIVRAPATYTGYWERTAGPMAKLPQGHKDRLMIGTWDVDHRVPLMSMIMYFYDAQKQELASYGTTSWLPGAGTGTIPPSFRFRITISSVPRMKDGAFVGEYIVDDKQLREALAANASSDGMVEAAPEAT